MPKPIEILVEAFYQKKYADVIGLIKTNPELVNAVDKEFGCSIFELAITGSKPDDATHELVTYMVTHPKFELGFKKPENPTNLATIISTERVDILSLVFKDPKDGKAFYDEGELTYSLAKKELESAQKALARNVQKNPNSITSQRGKISVDRLNEMVSMLRNATILHAMKTDNADLLTQLDKAGGNPTDLVITSAGKRLPSMLITTENTKIREWFKRCDDKATEVLAKSSLSLLAAGKALKDAVEHKESESERLEKEYLAKRAAVHTKAIDSLSERSDAIVIAMS
jgi:hypothetical protein